ncbi:MAG: NAD(P)-dependent oxidoreductase [Nocardioidaceae bacterium]
MTQTATRVAVTGGSGRLGRAVVRDLSEHGYAVVNLDRTPPPAGAPGDFVSVDLTDYGQVLGALTGLEDRYDGVTQIVHLAAVPAPGLLPNATTFVANISATHHVFAAARVAGIRTVVWASSETVLGLPFDTPPPYLPVDEEYHPRPESSYSLAKTLEEEMAHQLCRWDPSLRMVGLRFSNVMHPEDYDAFPGFDRDPQLRRWNLWGYIDARDGAQACRLALEHDATGCDVFIVANADTVMSTPSADLAAQVYPDVEVRGDLVGTQTLLSIEKARRVLGYEPQHSWRDHVVPDGGA